ncbi:MAG: tetratricopeptide repeat protein, partial [Amphiplicatus sp.]
IDASPIYEFGYYVHIVHFVMTSAQMAGDAKTGVAMAEKLDAKLPMDMAAAVPFAQPIKAAPYYALAQYGAPETVLQLKDPGDGLPFLKAAWRYARGEAYAKMGAVGKARAEADAIERIAASSDLASLEQANIPASQILDIMRYTVQSRAAAAGGDLALAIDAIGKAVALQEGLNYTEPPYWYYPAKQTLAALVLRQGDAERAEQLFIETLAEAPNNGWALYGLSEAYKAQKDKNGSKYAAGLFKKAWAGDRKTIAVERL